MIPLSLADIAKITGAVPDLVTEPGALAGSVVIDSRKAGPGALFAALSGERVDGHDFAGAAVAAGAVAVLVGLDQYVDVVALLDLPDRVPRLAARV